jgi:hypothetical protein
MIEIPRDAPGSVASISRSIALPKVTAMRQVWADKH